MLDFSSDPILQFGREDFLCCKLSAQSCFTYSKIRFLTYTLLKSFETLSGCPIISRIKILWPDLSFFGDNPPSIQSKFDQQTYCKKSQKCQ